jgi:hypothetical protein
MKRILLLCLAIVMFATTAAAQKDKPWTDWNDKEVLKMLTDSAWAQTQKELSDAGASGPAITTAAENRSNISANRDAGGSESGQTLGQKSQTLTLYYRLSFLSAKPVRQAFVRLLELQKPDTPAATVAERRTFVDKDFGDNIVVTLKLEGSDMKKLTPARQSLGAANPETWKDIVYLERKDGKRVALKDYRAPSNDGMGAKFVFPRTLDGQPFLDANSGEVRVYMEINKMKVIRKFKVADMMYDGKLEY